MFAQFALMLAIGLESPGAGQVSFESSAVRLPDFVKVIGEATEESLVVGPELRNEVLVVSLKDSVGAELKAKLADILLAKWINQSEGLTLVPDVDRIKRDAQAKKTVTANLIKQSKALLRDALNGKLQVPKESEEDYGWIKESLNEPDARIWALAALQIPDSVYLGLDEGDEAAFSTTPNRSQRQLNGSGMAPLLDNWVKRQNDSIEEARKASMEEGDGEEEQIYRDYAKLLRETYGDKLFGTPITSSPAKVIATAEGAYDSGDPEFPGSPQVRITVYGANGQPIMGYQSSLDMIYRQLKDMEEYQKYRREHPEGEEEGGGEGGEQEPQPQEKFFPVPKETLKLLSDVKPDYSDNRRPMDEAIADMLRHPADKEPLGYLVGDVVLAWAKHTSKQVLAVLVDDDVTVMSNSVAPQGIAESTIEYLLTGYGRDSMEEWGSVIVGRPNTPNARFWEERINRADLQELLGVYERDYIPSLDVLAAFAARNPDAEYNGVYELATQTYRSTMWGVFGNSNAWDDLVLWGLLSDSQRSALRTGGRVRIAELNKAAQERLVHRLVHGYATLGSLDDQTRKPVWESMESMYFGEGEDEGGMSGGRVEPTELMPEGLPPAGYLEARSTREKYIVQLGPSGKMSDVLSMPMSAPEAAFMKVSYELQGGENSPITVDSFNNMVMGDRTYLDLMIVVAPQMGTVVGLMDEKAPNLANKFTLRNPPSDFSAEMAAALVKLEQSNGMKLMRMMMQMYGNDGGRGVIKP